VGSGTEVKLKLATFPPPPPPCWGVEVCVVVVVVLLLVDSDVRLDEEEDEELTSEMVRVADAGSLTRTSVLTRKVEVSKTWIPTW